MFAQDYYEDGELSADERGRSPRGAGSSARATAMRWEHKLAEGQDLPGFGSRRRGRWQTGGAGGDAFGKAPAASGLPMEEGERVRELRDYSGRLSRHSDKSDPMAGYLSSRQDSSKTEAKLDPELSLLTGRAPARAATGGDDRSKRLPTTDGNAIKEPKNKKKRKVGSSTSSSSSTTTSSTSRSAKKQAAKMSKQRKKVEKKQKKKAKKSKDKSKKEKHKKKKKKKDQV